MRRRQVLKQFAGLCDPDLSTSCRSNITYIETGSEMIIKSETKLTFVRLTDISPDEFIAHMSDMRVAEHMPLLTFKWDHDNVAKFIATKEECWQRDGLGHCEMYLD